ncbi:MAG TPA: hypothetical protein VIN05_09125 [Roseovarius sp.]
MYPSQIPLPHQPARHARLFELIRQQSQALRVAVDAASDPVQNDAVMAEFARRAAESWRRSR